jgi:hypothetical protein
MKIYYRQHEAVVPSSSNPIVIEENNMVRQLHFTGFSPPDLSAGINAVGIYEYNTATSSCTGPIYPSDRKGTIPVLFNDRSSLPVINW